MGTVNSGGSEGSKGPDIGPPTQTTLVIRVWRETESPEPFRARLIAGSADGDEPTVTYARGRAEVIAAVNRWLCNFPAEQELPDPALSKEGFFPRKRREALVIARRITSAAGSFPDCNAITLACIRAKNLYVSLCGS